MAQATSPVVEPQLGQKVTASDYRNLGLVLTVFIALFVYLGRLADEPVPSPTLVLGPMLAMGSVVAVVWLVMVIFRNLATLRGDTPSAYYIAFRAPAPADWIERPARVFNNLMQLPTLFHVVCLLMLVTQRFDRVQLAYAWLFVALRALHAIVYMAWNVVAYRFGMWLLGSITLFVLWLRFAIQAWPGF